MSPTGLLSVYASAPFLVLAALSVAGFVVLVRVIGGRVLGRRIVALSAIALLAALLAGGLLVRSELDEEERQMADELDEFAVIYAQETELLGHHLLATGGGEPEGSPAARAREAIHAAQVRWLKANQFIADIYTIRREPGLGGRMQYRLVVDSHTDYDKDGVISPGREETSPPGKELPEPLPGSERAYEGTAVFQGTPYEDEWGYWISAFTPLRAPDGSIEAVLGLDYPADRWLISLRQRELATLGFVGAGILVGLAALGGIGAMRGAQAAAMARVEQARARAQRELEVAREIQHGLLPTQPPTVPGYEFAGFSRAADETGGDHYDWMGLGDGRVLVTLADVSGHGLGPALMTTVCRAYTRAAASGERVEVESMVGCVDRLLREDLPMGRFVTFAAALVDPASHTVAFLSAGHAPSFVVRAGTGAVEVMEADVTPIGVPFDEGFPKAREIRLEPGDSVVLLSDCCFEWMRADGESFGIERLAEALRVNARGPAAESIVRVCAEVERWGMQPQPDDMTMVVIRRTP